MGGAIGAGQRWRRSWILTVFACRDENIVEMPPAILLDFDRNLAILLDFDRNIWVYWLSGV